MEKRNGFLFQKKLRIKLKTFVERTALSSRLVPGILGVVLIVTLLFATIFSSNVLVNHAYEREVEQTEASANALSVIVAGLLERVSGVVDVAIMEQQTEISIRRAIEHSDRQVALVHLQKYLDYSSLSFIELILPDGKVFVSTHRESRVGKNASEWDFFRKTTVTDRVVSLTSLQGELHAAASAVLRSEGRVLGTLVFGIEIDDRAIETWSRSLTADVSLEVDGVPVYSTLDTSKPIWGEWPVFLEKARVHTWDGNVFASRVLPLSDHRNQVVARLLVSKPLSSFVRSINQSLFETGFYVLPVALFALLLIYLISKSVSVLNERLDRRIRNTDRILEFTRALGKCSSLEEIEAFLTEQAGKLIAGFELRLLRFDSGESNSLIEKTVLKRTFESDTGEIRYSLVCLGGRSVTSEERTAFDMIVSTLDIAFQNQVFQAEKVLHEKSRAIAKTTQMLAHDVRKPFTLFGMIIDTVEAVEDPMTAKKLLKQSLPEVQQAIVRINGLIHDIMEIDADSSGLREPIDPLILIETALFDINRVYVATQVQVNYDLTHRNMVNVDLRKVNRVFSNIFENAFQAMAFSGSVDVRTKDSGSGFVEFRIGNSGSYIPAEILPRLFEAFFTHNKKGGTGLGLAIAQKVVQAHGGSIRCDSLRNESYPEGYVEFVFTLPQAECFALKEIQPLSENGVRLGAQALQHSSEQKVENPSLEVEALGLMTQQTSRVAVLIVDDEAIYRNSLERLLSRSDLLNQKLRLLFAANSIEALKIAVSENPLLVIMDIDLGCSSADGIETVLNMRKLGFTGYICVHSNRILRSDSEKSLWAGANTVLPKPMVWRDFLNLLKTALSV